jgi:L-amino acid N-acyltransferase YncA
MTFEVRPARLSDLDAILSIWHERPGADSDLDRRDLVAHRVDFKDRISGQEETFRFWVATSDGACIGWSSLQRMRSSPSLKGTMAEWSIYVSVMSRGQSVGSRLATATIDHARESGLEWVLGFVAGTNGPCIGMFEQYGFKRLGTFPVPTGNGRRPEVILFALDVS